MDKIYLVIQSDYYCDGQMVLGAFTTEELARNWLMAYESNFILHGNEVFSLAHVMVNPEYNLVTYKCSECDYTTEKGDDEHECNKDSYLEEME